MTYLYAFIGGIVFVLLIQFAVWYFLARSSDLDWEHFE